MRSAQLQPFVRAASNHQQAFAKSHIWQKTFLQASPGVSVINRKSGRVNRLTKDDLSHGSVKQSTCVLSKILVPLGICRGISHYSKFSFSIFLKVILLIPMQCQISELSKSVVRLCIEQSLLSVCRGPFLAFLGKTCQMVIDSNLKNNFHNQ